MNGENNPNNGGQIFIEEPAANNTQPAAGKEEKKVKSYCPLLIVFMIISLALTGYLVYESSFKKDEKSDGNITNVNQTNCVTKNETPKKVDSANLKVVDAYVGNEVGGSYEEFSVKIPKIDGETLEISKLNATMMQDSLKRIMKYKDFMVEQMGEVSGTKIKLNNEAKTFFDCYKAFNYNYEVNKINNILIIKINYELENKKYDASGASCWSASGKSGNIDEYYFYDMENDKSLTYLEAANKTNAQFTGNSACENYSDLSNYGVENITLAIANGSMQFECSE